MDRTTRFSDQILQAYADGVLDAATVHALEAAMQHDAALALRVAQLRRQAIGAASAKAGAKAGAKVVQLAGVRAERAAAARKAGSRRWGALAWAGVLLSVALIVGLILMGVLGSRTGWWSLSPHGSAAAHGDNPASGAPAAPAGTGAIAALAAHDGVLLAQGSLLLALNQQPGGRSTPDGEIRMGQSFMTGDGNYCRSFSLLGMQQDLTGLACREEGLWQIPLLVQNRRSVPALGSHRSAAGDMPPLLQEAIRQRKAGAALDAQAEEQALQRRWQR